MTPALQLVVSIGGLAATLLASASAAVSSNVVSGGGAVYEAYDTKGYQDRTYHVPARQQARAAACGGIAAGTKATSFDAQTGGFPSAASSPGMPWLVKARRSREPSSGARKAAVVLALRGGSTAVLGGVEDKGEAKVDVQARSIKVMVSTTKISSYVDARCEVAARSDWTIGRLQEELEKKFPGKIPASLQRLFKGTQLLPSSMTLEDASEGAEGPLSLLLDNPPPIDASKFDPDTAVPSRREGQVEAFSACLAAQSALQESLLAVMRGDSGRDDQELTQSVKMKADFENTQVLLRRTLEEIPDSGMEEQETFGVLHEALRPLAHSLDVNWMQSAQYAIFVYICAQFGSTGAVRQGLTMMLIPLIFLAQTRTARVGFKLARNLAAEIPVLTQLFLGLLQAPGQAIMSLDTAAYTRDLYGPGGPKFDAAFLEHEEDDGGEGSGDGDAGDDDSFSGSLSDDDLLD